jgi:hypothetical protein
MVLSSACGIDSTRTFVWDELCDEVEGNMGIGIARIMLKRNKPSRTTRFMIRMKKIMWSE